MTLPVTRSAIPVAPADHSVHLNPTEVIVTTTPSSEVVSDIGFVAAATGRRRSIALIVVLLAMFMDLLDNTIINVTLPPIHKDLDGPYSTVQWIAAGRRCVAEGSSTQSAAWWGCAWA